MANATASAEDIFRLFHYDVVTAAAAAATNTTKLLSPFLTGLSLVSSRDYFKLS